MRTLILLFCICSEALAETPTYVFTPNGGIIGQCSVNGSQYFPARSNGICYSEDQWMIGPSTVTTVVNDLECDKDQELVMRRSGRYGCSKEITDPH